MSKLEFRVEWEDAPGVKDEVLARTWARLEIQVADSCVTSVLDSRSQSVRAGVHGAIFPLAHWIVHNWWFLLNEAPRSSELSARKITALRERTWMQRHNLLAAREGGSLPDLTIMRDGRDVTVAWDEDPPDMRDRPVRFISSGRAELSLESIQSSLSDLVNLVLDRLGAVEHEEAQRVRMDWSEVARSMHEERILCESAARLGLDPYDPEELTEARIELLEEAFQALPRSLAYDFLDATTTQRLELALRRVMKGTQEIETLTGTPVDLEALQRKLGNNKNMASPHEAGYALARRFRNDILGLGEDEAIHDLPRLLVSKMGWKPALQPFDLADRNLKGIVGVSSNGTAHLMATQTSETSSRFLQGRALYDLVSGRCADGPRLLTSAPTRAQASGRAFAAELLAPSTALKARLDEGTLVEEDDLHDLSQEFRVSEQVIALQLKNHHIATVAYG
ncbi:ImmA/IrrE family metallo-endopeptidase [Sorangium sp. So ce1151]|uniref:ImmA/IrrE family metallo-endopeptidase n=1 Tax=Sorangium sp. So ce1151 TaxID=3133332 RepID=UPI003F63B6C5